MRSSKITFAVPVLFFLVLGACSKDSKHSIEARAATAVTKEQQRKVYTEAESSIDKDIAVLAENDVHTMDKNVGFFTRAFHDIFFSKPSNPALVSKTLESIISKADSQIDLARKLGDPKRTYHARLTKAKAQKTLSYL